MTNTVLADAASRLSDTLDVVVDGLSQEPAERRPSEGANHICWLLWHSGRCIDQQLHAIVGGDELWQRWRDRIALPLRDDQLGQGQMGYQQSAEDAARVIAPVTDLSAYLQGCIEELTDHCREVTDEQLAAVVDEAWDPPVKHSERLVSIIDDVAQHLGAAAYLRAVVG